MTLTQKIQAAVAASALTAKRALRFGRALRQQSDTDPDLLEFVSLQNLGDRHEIVCALTTYVTITIDHDDDGPGRLSFTKSETAPGV